MIMMMIALAAASAAPDQTALQASVIQGVETDLSSADAAMRESRFATAARRYAGLADRAEAAGDLRLFARIKLRQASAAHLDERDFEAARALKAVAAIEDPELRPALCARGEEIVPKLLDGALGHRRQLCKPAPDPAFGDPDDDLSSAGSQNVGFAIGRSLTGATSRRPRPGRGWPAVRELPFEHAQDSRAAARPARLAGCQ